MQARPLQPTCIARLVVEVLILMSTLAFAIPSNAALSVTLTDEPYVVFRQGVNGWERQVPLTMVNDGSQVESMNLRVVASARTIECPLELIPTGTSHDVVWIPDSNTAATIEVQLGQSDAPLVKQKITLARAPIDSVVAIPMSPIIKLIPPLSIRGTNYLPREWPWPGLHREASVLNFEEDFALMRRLSMNTMRTFAFYDPDTDQASYGLYRKDGSATTRAQKRLSDLLAAADRYHIKVVLNAGALPPLEDIPAARRMFKTVLSPFANDGRILMFDVMNEPGGDAGPKASKTLSTWLQTMYPYARQVLPNHLLTVGLCWQFDQLWDLGIRPDVGQFHNYSGAVGRQPKGKPAVRNVSDDLRNIRKLIGNRPLLIGEYGNSTSAEDSRGVSETRQREIYQGVFEGAEDQRIAGVLSWTLFDFIPDWMGKFEQKFGIILVDGTMKPAGILLQQTYRRWAKQHPAPWDSQQ